MIFLSPGYSSAGISPTSQHSFSSGLAGSLRNFDSLQLLALQSDSGGVSKVTSPVLFDFDLLSSMAVFQSLSILPKFQYIAELTTMSVTKSPAPPAPASAAASAASSLDPAFAALVPVPEEL